MCQKWAMGNLKKSVIDVCVTIPASTTFSRYEDAPPASNC